MTNMGPLPISFDIDADDLAAAVAKYPEATKVGIERAMRELQELRGQASSSIVLPPAGAALGPGGPLGGGGKIQIPRPGRSLGRRPRYARRQASIGPRAL